MDFTTTSIRRRARGMTLVELLVATAIGGMVLTSVLALTFFSARSFAAMANYVDLDNASRNALDIMAREIRQADCLISGDEHELVFQHTNPANGTVSTLSYLYNPDTRKLVRLQAGGVRTVLLEGCDYLKFSIYQRNPIGGTYDQYPTANPGTCKLVQLSWICSRDILGKKANTESVQSAKIVIRKQ